MGYVFAGDFVLFIIISIARLKMNKQYKVKRPRTKHKKKGDPESKPLLKSNQETGGT